jgi:hypothetical protein
MEAVKRSRKKNLELRRAQASTGIKQVVRHKLQSACGAESSPKELTEYDTQFSKSYMKEDTDSDEADGIRKQDH